MIFGAYGEFLCPPDTATLAKMLADGRVVPIVGKVFSIEQAKKPIVWLRRNKGWG